MLYILEVIQMIGFNIQNYLGSRAKMQKTVHIFTGFRYEVIAAPDANISAYFPEISAD